MSDAAWALVENVITVVCASLLAYFVSPWCLLLLLNINQHIPIADGDVSSEHRPGAPANCPACQKAGRGNQTDNGVADAAKTAAGGGELSVLIKNAHTIADFVHRAEDGPIEALHQAIDMLAARVH